MNYERPEVLATYTEEELVEEAAICVVYGGGGGGCDPLTDPTCGN
jgi:hypothetical protein